MKGKLLDIVIIVLVILIIVGTTIYLSIDKTPVPETTPVVDNPPEEEPEEEFVGDKYTLTFSTEELTNQDVTVNIKANINNFSYFVDSLSNKIDDSSFDVTIKENGDYHYFMYNTKGTVEIINFTIKNIDKEAPTGTCKVTVAGDKITMAIDAKDNNKIQKYVYLDKEYQEKEFELKEQKDNYNVDIYDEATNKTTIACKVDYLYEKPIMPTNEKVIAKYDSQTFKYWIEKPHSDYSVTHIWMMDAYNQMKTAIPEKFRTLAKTKTIMELAIAKNNYQNKGMVAMNGSGFVSKQFDSYFISAVKEWENTSLAPIVIVDGQVLRNFTNLNMPDTKRLVYGLKKDGYLGYYGFPNGKDHAANTQTAQRIIADGIRYTFDFSPVLIDNYQVATSINDHHIAQGICQIDKNNFVIVTNTVGSASNGFSYKELAQYMMKFKCKIAINCDGGGSVNLYYKDNTNTLNSFKNTSRAVADIVYFVEK